MTYLIPGSRAWWIDLLRRSFGLSFWLFAAFALVMAVISYYVLGPEAFITTVDEDLQLLADMLPRVAAALTLAGFVWVLLPRDRFSELLMKNRGTRGLLIAEVAGIITPGGPASAFPLLAVMGGAGADRGILVTYITSWAILGLQRVLVWDLPFMGPEFSLTRFLVGLPLPILAGMIARRLPLTLKLQEEPARQQETPPQHRPEP